MEEQAREKLTAFFEVFHQAPIHDASWLASRELTTPSFTCKAFSVLQSKRFDGPDAIFGTATPTADDEGIPEQSEAFSKASTNKARNKAESNRCREQDNNRCVVTNTQDAEFCHIIPFAWNSCESNLVKTKKFKRSLIRCFGLEDTISALHGPSTLTDGLGSSDKTWNMLTLNPWLHVWWGKGFFAFKWLGVLPPHPDRLDTQEVQLQFRWMLRSQTSNGTDLVNLKDPRDPTKSLLGSMDHFYGPGTHQQRQCHVDYNHCAETIGRAITNPLTCHSIEFGTIITVARDSDSIDKFKVMIDIQWALFEQQRCLALL
ncbi:hypothetical protein EDB81DRAFT_932172 [Dactylonectria macrodidyma]|uniref:HNH nuclease domain-containing protein n=1 Tax=Dactylonectria macrodidyma TaxID=307937 RepID=A0A9P9JE08_9HYPO|nr:hypothetical protein EDB81DRAFT_932172 [Dactylonectria macrodidyma]